MSKVSVIKIVGRAFYARNRCSARKTRALRIILFVLTVIPAITFADEGLTRERPGGEPVPFDFYNYESLPRPDASNDFTPVRDRWRQFYAGKWYDPYNQNALKGDIPVFGEPGEEWFTELGLISDTSFERRKIALPVGSASTSGPNRLNTLGNGYLSLLNTTLIPSFSLIKGNTTFKPQDFELRVTPAVTFNHAEAEETGVLEVDPSEGKTRDDAHLGFLELFIDKHLMNLSDRYDFISTRIGIQKFQSDFRGFVFSDEQPGARLFGNFDNNKWQANLAWFYRLDKDTNSGINTWDARYENVFVANLFRQDVPVLGHQIEFSVVHRTDDAGSHGQHYNDNGFLTRPAAFGDERSKNIDSTYFGINGEGHFGRLNSSTSFYYVTGSESHNQISGTSEDISAELFAQELSIDKDWMRFRVSFLWASGDDDPFDGKANGFSAISDSPNFAGGDLSFFQRQFIPLIAGGGVNLTSGGSFLPDLRPGKEEGQSNFVNPGLWLYNIGADFNILPELTMITNASYLRFDNTSSLETLRQDSSFGQEIGYDISLGFVYRPFLSNNVQFRFGASTLFPGSGIKTLYGDEMMYNAFTNLVLQY